MPGISLSPLRGVRWWLVFLLAGVLFMAFGVVSFNLFRLLQANLSLFADYGAMVIDDGALRQLAELVLMGYVSLLLWIGFKTCEGWLVHQFGKPPSAEPRNPAREV